MTYTCGAASRQLLTKVLCTVRNWQSCVIPVIHQIGAEDNIFVSFMSTLIDIFQQKQPKPCSCTHLQVIEKRHRKIITKMPAKYQYFDYIEKECKQIFLKVL